MDSIVQIGFVVIAVLVGVAIIVTTRTQPTFVEYQARTRESQQELHERLAADPGWPAEEKFSKDMAQFRHDNAYAMRLGRAAPAEELRAA